MCKPGSKGKMRRWASPMCAALLGGAVLLALQEKQHIVVSRWLAVLFWLLPMALVVGLARYLADRRKHRAAGAEWLLPGRVLLVFNALYLLSGIAAHSNFFFLKWHPLQTWSSLLFGSWLGRTFFLSALLTPLMCLPVFRRKGWWILFIVLVAIQIRCFHEFFQNTYGLPLYGFDHPSFMMRFYALGRSLPQIVFYNPLWNGGKAAPYAVASGCIPLAFLTWPLWRFAPVLRVYTPFLAILFIVVIPYSVYLGVRLLRGTRVAAFAAALLAVGVNRQIFLWLLHFGTVGACTALAMLPLVTASLCAAIYRRQTGLGAGLALVLAGYLYLAWPPAAIIALPVGVALVVSMPRWNRRKTVFLIVCGAIIFLACLPLAFAITQQVDVGFFFDEAGRGADLSYALRRGWYRLQRSLRDGNPILLFLGIAGVFFSRRRDIRIFFSVVMAGLLLMTGWGAEVKPGLELGRAAIALFYVACIPAGLWIGDLLRDRSPVGAPWRAFAVVLLVMGGLNTVRIYENKSLARYRLMPEEIATLTDWIKAETPPNGRILFAGQAVHGYGAGTVAFLPVLAEREMMSSDYYQFSPKKVAYRYPPSPFRNSAERVYEFMELYNVTHIVTYHKKWKKHFRVRPEKYEEVFEYRSRTLEKSVFRVRREADYFMKGRGTVRAGINVLHVTVDDPTEQIVLKYNWADGLRADNGATVEPYEVEKSVTFIAAQPNGAASFDIVF